MKSPTGSATSEELATNIVPLTIAMHNQQRWLDAFFFMTREPHWKIRLLIGGLVLLVCPPLGWPLALGYRREVALRLVEGRTPLLPAWRGDWLACLSNGLIAASVILVYVTPYLALFWFLALDDWAEVSAHGTEIIWFVLVTPVLIPVTVSLLPPLYALWFPWVHVSADKWTLLAIVLVVIAFLMPAVFLQVSLYGRFRDTFRLAAAVRFIRWNPRAYLRAWGISLAATLIALLSGPLLPWGIFWSYLVIVYAFNDALASWNDPLVLQRFQDSPLRRCDPPEW